MLPVDHPRFPPIRLEDECVSTKSNFQIFRCSLFHKPNFSWRRWSSKIECFERHHPFIQSKRQAWNEDRIQREDGETDSFGNFRGAPWMGCSEFLERRCEILIDGRLTVIYELRRLYTEESASVLQEKLPSEEKITAENEASERDSDEEETGAEWKTLKKMQRDLRNLLISEEDCDVTIKVQGKEFPAHRNILRARSPVFKSMFSHEMVEKQSGVVVIDDCDPDTFPDFLNYVYTGSTKHICVENVFRLYTVSDKYGVEELKEECAAFMKSKVSVGTFCDVITLALRHTETELVDTATAFFSANLTKIIKTEKWQTFLHENTTMGNELLIKAVSNGKNA